MSGSFAGLRPALTASGEKGHKKGAKRALYGFNEIRLTLLR